MDLRELYERRAAQQYPVPEPRPDPRVDRKFERVWALVREQLPCRAFLDAGCGSGLYLEALGTLEERPARIAGVDLSQRILETARQTAARSGVEPELRQASLDALPFDDGEFDVVLCTQVLEHVPDPEAALRELARVLEPEGRFVITTDNRRNVVTRVLNAPRNEVVRALGLRGRRGRIESPATPFHASEFRALLDQAGLPPARLETFRFTLLWPFGPPAALRALNAVERALPPHGLGDILAAVGCKAAA